MPQTYGNFSLGEETHYSVLHIKKALPWTLQNFRFSKKKQTHDFFEAIQPTRSTNGQPTGLIQENHSRSWFLHHFL